MTTEFDDFRSALLAAVEAEMKRHGEAVVAEVERLREEGRRERAEIRSDFTQQISTLAQALEQIESRGDASADKVRKALEQRLDESEARQTRRLDDRMAGIDGIVQEAARPLILGIRDENEGLSHKVELLENNLRKFDEQAARMVTYFNDVSQRIETRQDEAAETMQADVEARIAGVKQIVDENDSAIRRFQSDISQSVTQKVNDAEDRFNNRLLAAESRIKEDAGQKIAEIDVHVSRVSSGLDETMAVLNDRISALDDRFVETNRKIQSVEESVSGIDQDALEELKSKMSTAAGEAMLVRIEMERFEKTVNDRSDELVVRLTEVEASLADASLDVSTAVQLDRMEEIERALLELDPTQFVRKSEAGGAGFAAPTAGAAQPSANSDDLLKNGGGGADDTSGVDYSAIIASAERSQDTTSRD
jgi:hypothetical protein